MHIFVEYAANCKSLMLHESYNIIWHIFTRCHHQDVGFAGGTTRSSSVAVERRLQKESQLSSPTPSWGLAQASCAKQLPKRLAGVRGGSILLRQNACYILSQSVQAMWTKVCVLDLIVAVYMP